MSATHAPTARPAVTGPVPRTRPATGTPAPALRRVTLPNGLRVLLAPAAGAAAVGVAVHVDVGFRSEPEGRTGFAHLFEHLMFQGSESLRKPAHARYVYGSGGIYNGSTHPDYTDFFGVLPAEALERALFLEADRLRAPALTEENLRTQVEVVKEEIRLNVLSRPYGGFPWIPLPTVLYDTFANAHNGYGDFSELERTTVDDAAAFFDTHYAPGNVVLTVAGDLDVDRTVALIERHFGDIPARPTPPRGSFDEPAPGTGRRRTVPDPQAPLPALALGYRLPDPATDADGYLAQALLGSVLAEGGAARLQRRLVAGGTTEARVTSIAAGCGLFGIPFNARTPDTFTVTAVHPADVDPDRVAAAVDDEIERLAEKGPDADELARVAARWSASVHQKQDRSMSRLLALGSREVLYGRAELVHELPARLAAVTPARVAEAEARLGAEGRAVLLVEPDRSAGGGAGHAVPARTATVAGPSAAGSAHRSPEQIARTPEGPRPVPPLVPTGSEAAPEPVARTLPSGLRVVAVARRSVPMVELRLRIPFADPAPRPVPGADPSHRARAELLAASMLSGTGRRDHAALDRELAGVGADIGVTVDAERLWISVSGLADGLPTVLAVLADLLVGAAYPEPDVLRERRRLVERTAVTGAQPRTVAREAVARHRYGDHPAGREAPSASDLGAVTAAALRELHREAVLPTGSTLVMVGDLDPERVLDQVARALGGWDRPGRAVELGAPPPAPGGELVLVDRPGAMQSQLRLAAPAVGRADARYAAVQLANLCFGGYGSSRLGANLREDKGYTYHAASRLEHTPHGASLLIDTDVTREVTAAAMREIRGELRRLADTPPSNAEIDAARRFAVGTLLISLDSQPGLASTLAALAEEDLDAAWLRGHPERLESVTGDQVAEAAAEFFVPAAFTEVVVGDAASIGSGLRDLGPA